MDYELDITQMTFRELRELRFAISRGEVGTTTEHLDELRKYIQERAKQITFLKLCLDRECER